MAAPTASSDILSNCCQTGSWLGLAHGEAAAPKARLARCSLPRSVPSVRLNMTGSGGPQELGQGKLGNRKGRRSSWAHGPVAPTLWRPSGGPLPPNPQSLSE